MILEHLAAILFFSGPLFYVGLWMVGDPAGIACLPEFLVRAFRHLITNSGGQISEAVMESEAAAISRRVRRAFRLTGVALLLIAIVV